jgi:hypothetical protein
MVLSFSGIIFKVSTNWSIMPRFSSIKQNKVDANKYFKCIYI